MPMKPAKPHATIRLDFRHHGDLPGGRDEPVSSNLSVAEVVGNCLFVASDEGAAVERLVTEDGQRYGDHHSFLLADLFDLPAGPEGEADLEGVAADGDWLWVVGSHSLARKKPKPQEADAVATLARLTEVKRDPNRFLLGRIPLVAAEETGVYDLARRDGARTAACLPMKKRKGNALTKRLKDDEHIGRFLDVPAKENGFDVEGLAVRGNRVFLGLRGPVLRGWACILELSLIEEEPGRLALRPVGCGDLPYHKHFLDLDGLGIRELTFDGDDLLILAGPTMDLDGPVVVYRWCGALEATHQSVVPRDRLVRVFPLPHGIGFDHAEGVARLDRAGEPPLLLVVYDNPGKARLHDGGRGVDADLFAVPA